eukprot:gb/GECG01011613.1/.p1 GENE.gb/GECG01011613.1/~~gb/GECG01011613.1/.p1  ORF type:complete len:137 (+),score=7.67 gb/GECG01011613.1/:1-411(+)
MSTIFLSSLSMLLHSLQPLFHFALGAARRIFATFEAIHESASMTLWLTLRSCGRRRISMYYSQRTPMPSDGGARGRRRFAGSKVVQKAKHCHLQSYHAHIYPDEQHTMSNSQYHLNESSLALVKVATPTEKSLAPA